MTSVAIVGAGLSGLVVAQRLGAHAEPVVFEKSRGVGGRMATRYADAFEFDHGAQFFTVRTAAFQEFLEPMRADGVVADWRAQFAELEGSRVLATRRWNDDHRHLVGTPRMNSIGKYLAKSLDIRSNTRVARVERDGSGWAVFDAEEQELGCFDWLVVTTPGPQAETLLNNDAEIVRLSRQRSMLGCYALMLGFREPLNLAWQAALVHDADISWISENSSKPGRNGLFTLVIHSTNAWAGRHIDDDLENVREHLTREASRVVGEDLRVAEHREVHRWRYANVDKQSGPASFVDANRRLAVCGDWFVRGRVEAAFTSANDLSRRLLDCL